MLEIIRLQVEIHLRQRPVGMPTENDFQFVKVDVLDPRDGEFLVHNIWMSLIHTCVDL